MKTTLLFMFMIAAWQPADTPGWQNFVLGDFAKARELAAAAGTTDGLALACRSGLVIGGFQQTGSDAVRSLHRALRDCGTALEQDPHNIVASISYAIALGYEGKRLKKASYIKAARERLEHCLAHHPDDPLVTAALGGWHSAVSNAGFLARLALGGSREEAETYFRLAIALDSTSIGTRFEYVRFLARGNKSERAQALKQLEILQTLPPQDAAEKIMLSRLMELKAPLEAGDKKEARETVARTSAFRDIRDWQEAEAFPLVPIENYKSSSS